MTDDPKIVSPEVLPAVKYAGPDFDALDKLRKLAHKKSTRLSVQKRREVLEAINTLQAALELIHDANKELKRMSERMSGR